jgi:lipoprotein-anchoring transpeptidase ErfK/SrfK
MRILSTRSALIPAALLGLLALLLTACAGATVAGKGSAATLVSAPSSGSTAAPTAPATSPSSTPTPTPAALPVHVTSLESDGLTYGVGMPIVFYFDNKITDAAAFVKAAKVTVNGADPGGAWFFEVSARAGQQIEAHYRPQNYWPAHANIHVAAPVHGLSGGSGFVFGNDLTLDFATGAAHILAVDGATHRMTITTDGVLYGTFPVSLGAPTSQTMLGINVISQRDRNTRMVGSGYDEIVPWSMRITASGEYLHAAPWNVANIGSRSTSKGCTNLLPADAEKLYNYLQVGDPVSYTNTGSTTVAPVNDGYGDWNAPWGSWLLGGVLQT